MATPIQSGPHNLRRFVRAQDRDSSYHQALAEIQAGRKVTHWIWFVFPRLIGPDYSEMSEYYAIKDQQEAEAYLRHPVLGPRLVECARAVLANQDRTLLEIFGPVDGPKVRQCAELFGSLPGADPVFKRLLAKK